MILSDSQRLDKYYKHNQGISHGQNRRQGAAGCNTGIDINYTLNYVKTIDNFFTLMSMTST